MSETPDYAAMLDKEFGNTTPPADATDKVEPIPAEPDTALEAPEIEQPIDAAGVLRHADYTRKMQALAREREEIAELHQLKQQLDADPTLRERFVSAWEGANGQAEAPAPSADPNTAALNARIARLEATIAQQGFQSHASQVDEAALRVAKEHGLSVKDAQALVVEAVNLDLLRPGTKGDVIEKQLRAVAAMRALPRAKADGQRELLDQIKDKGKGASPVVERPAPPDPEPDYGKMSEKAFVSRMIAEAERGAGHP